MRDYQKGFDAETARYQLAEPFTHIRHAADYFHACYEREQFGMSCVRLLIDDAGQFIGSIEADGLWGDAPDLGLWIAAAHRRNGYGEEALCRFLSVLQDFGYSHFRYETDRRNLPSVHLIEKLGGEPDSMETVETPTGKRLELVLYRLE